MLYFLVSLCSFPALPVIRAFYGSELFKTQSGNGNHRCTIFDDLTGWLIFSFVLSLMGQQGRSQVYGLQSG